MACLEHRAEHRVGATMLGYIRSRFRDLPTRTAGLAGLVPAEIRRDMLHLQFVLHGLLRREGSTGPKSGKLQKSKSQAVAR